MNKQEQRKKEDKRMNSNGRKNHPLFPFKFSLLLLQLPSPFVHPHYVFYWLY